jgi:hypothetical protein
VSAEPYLQIHGLAATTSSKKESSEPVAYMDSAATGTIFRKPYSRLVRLIREVRNMKVSGVTGSSIPITHVAESKAVGKVHIVPGAVENLISIPVLMRNGCTLVAAGEQMRVYDPGGRLKLVAKMNEKGMYVVRLNEIANDGTGAATELGTLVNRAKQLVEEGNTVYMHKDRTTLKDKSGTRSVMKNMVLEPVVNGYSFDLILTTEQRERAKRARLVHCILGHPCDDVLCQGLDNGVYQDLGGLTGEDVKNAEKMLGPCEACVEAKMVAPEEPPSDHPPATRVGEHLFMDLHALTKGHVDSLGGHRQWILGVDEKSGMPFSVGAATKTQKSICEGIDAVIAGFNQYGHRVENITFDSEAVFIACGDYIRSRGISPHYTPAGLHNKRAERLVRQLKEKREAIKCSLPYELPDVLYGELLAAAIEAIGSVPNKATGPTMTPYQMVTKTRPAVKKHQFGQPGLCYSKRQDAPDQRAEWSMFLGGSGVRDVRVYIPLRKGVYSRRKFVATDGYPEDWGYKRRLRIVPTKKEKLLEKMRDTQPMGESEANKLIQEMEKNIDQRPAEQGVPMQTQGVPIQTQGVPMQTQGVPIQVQGVPMTQVEERLVQHENAVQEKVVERIEIPVQTEPVKTVEVTSLSDRQEQKRTDDTYGRRSSERLRLKQENTSVQKETTYGKYYPGMKEHAAHLGVLDSDIIVRLSEIGVGDNDLEDLRACMAETVRESILEVYTAEEADAYVNGLVYNIPMCDADAWVDELLAFRVSLQQALKEQDKDKLKIIVDSINEEIDNMVKKNRALRPVMPNSLSKQEKDNRLPAHTFLKFKELATGVLERVKARTVAGGNYVDRETVSETRAPTIGIMSVLLLIAIATAIGYSIWTFDIAGAFLIPEIEPGSIKRHIYMDRIMSQMYVERYPEFGKYLDQEGRLTFELLKYLYGLPEAAYQFYMYMKRYLERQGFEALPEDPCVFRRGEKGNTLWIGLLVDDLLTCGKVEELEKFKDQLSMDFEIKWHSESRISYIGLDIWTQDNKDRLVGQGGCRTRVLERFSNMVKAVTRKVKVAGNSDAFKINTIRDGEDELLAPKARKLYISGVMSLMYLSRLTRYDMLFWNSYLSTRCKEPNKADMQDLCRTMKYLADSGNWAIRYKYGVRVAVKLWVDASHQLHKDGKGQMGIAISLGSGVIHCKSSKLTMMTRSTFESEWVSMCEATCYVYWLRSILQRLGFSFKDETRRPRPIMYEDNLSAIWGSRQDLTFARNKHLLGSRNFFKEAQDKELVSVVHCGSPSMVADILTKQETELVVAKHMKAMGMEKIDD